jgi:hypothetical protein
MEEHVTRHGPDDLRHLLDEARERLERGSGGVPVVRVAPAGPGDVEVDFRGNGLGRRSKGEKGELIVNSIQRPDNVCPQIRQIPFRTASDTIGGGINRSDFGTQRSRHIQTLHVLEFEFRRSLSQQSAEPKF